MFARVLPATGLGALAIAVLASALPPAPSGALAQGGQDDRATAEGAVEAQDEGGAEADVLSQEEAAEQIERYRERAEASDDPKDRFNLGTAYLAAGQWPEARAELERSAEEGEGKVERFSRYNLGMANAMEGHPDGEAPDDERRQRLLAAREDFREVLRADPEDLNARWNLELVDRWLEEMSSSGGASDQDQQQQGGAGGSAGQQGPAEPGGEAPTLTREEAEQLLRQAAGAEEDVRNKTLRRGRLRDPVVERNW